MPKNQNRNNSRWAFIISAVILAGGLGFGFGLYSAVTRNAIFHLVRNIWRDVKLVSSEAENIVPGGEPIHFLQPSRKLGTGVTVNERADDGKLLLLAGFFDGGNELRLIRRDGSPVARWPVSFQEHFPNPAHLTKPPKTDRNVDLHGAIINPDGSVVFNYEYSGTVKLSRCNEPIWALAHPTHHSVESAETGGYWIPGVRYIVNGFPPFTNRANDVFEDGLILRVTEDGAIAEQISVFRILYDNNLEPLLTANGHSFLRERPPNFPELAHLNKIEELPRSMAAAFPRFEAGDLMISLRRYNLIVVVDPDNWRVKWHQTGPWRRQHDPEFNPDGTITVFNNNIYQDALRENDGSDPATPRVSNITKVNPATARTEVVHGGREGQEFLSVIRGKHDPTSEGGFLITEFEAGRVFEVDVRGRTVWEYINRYDPEQVLEITEARLYPSSYFTVKDWSCASTKASN